MPKTEPQSTSEANCGCLRCALAMTLHGHSMGTEGRAVFQALGTLVGDLLSDLDEAGRRAMRAEFQIGLRVSQERAADAGSDPSCTKH